MIAVDPCGCAVDMLRSAYSVRMRGLTSDGSSVRVKWYRVDDEAPWLDKYCRFASLNWTAGGYYDQADASVGEDPDSPRPWANGKPPKGRRRGVPCGDDKAWAEGYSPGVALSQTIGTGQTQCCAELRGGLALSGGARPASMNPVTISGSSTAVFEPGGIETDCCSGFRVPTQLQARFVEADEPCWFGVSIPITWDGTAWTGTGTVGSCGYDLTLTFWCEPGTFPFPAQWHMWATSSTLCVDSDGPIPFAVACDPLNVKFALGAGVWIGACSTEPILAGWLQVEPLVPAHPLDVVITSTDAHAEKRPYTVTVSGAPLAVLISSTDAHPRRIPETFVVAGAGLAVLVAGESTAVVNRPLNIVTGAPLSVLVDGSSTAVPG